MKPTKKIVRHGKSFKDRLYLPAVFSGMMVTFSHFWDNFKSSKRIKTLSYPEVMPKDITPRYRGAHRLTKREDGSIRCVACFMCSTACPAECIFIEAQERNDGVDEKMPKRFEIDLLECVFCGACVEACPCDAIRMDSGIFSITGKSRQSFIITRDELLATKAKKEDE
jgi:NADH-quinone oxidoreductase subunit I